MPKVWLRLRQALNDGLFHSHSPITYQWHGWGVETFLSPESPLRFGTVKLGYRFLEVGDRDLDGAYIGYAWHY